MVGKGTENPIKPGQASDLGVAIQGLIDDNFRALNTTFLAKVEVVNENGSVDISPLLLEKDIKQIVIPNVLVGQPLSAGWIINYEISAGDVGVALVCQNDISTYKTNGAGGEVNTNRRFSLNDCIFLPLSLFKQEKGEGLSISNAEKTTQIKISAGGELTIESSSPIEFKTSNTLLECFNVILDNLEPAILGGITAGSPSTQTIQSLPQMSAKIAQMKALIEKVVK